MRYFAALTLALGLAVAALTPIALAQSARLPESKHVQAAEWVQNNGIWQLRGSGGRGQ